MMTDSYEAWGLYVQRLPIPDRPPPPGMTWQEPYEWRLADGIFWRRTGPRSHRVIIRRTDQPLGGYRDISGHAEPITVAEYDFWIKYAGLAT